MVQVYHLDKHDGLGGKCVNKQSEMPVNLAVFWQLTTIQRFNQGIDLFVDVPSKEAAQYAKKESRSFHSYFKRVRLIF